MNSPSVLSQAARILALAPGNPPLAKQLAAGASDARVTLIVKALVDPLSADGTGVPLAETRTAFLEAVTPRSALLRLLEAAYPVPARVRAVIATGTARAGVVGEARPVPVASVALAAAELPERVAAAILVLSAELIRSGGPAGLKLLDAALRDGVAEAMDRELFAVATAGLTPILASGAGAAAVLGTLKAALAATDTRAGELLWAAAPDVARALATVATTTGAAAFPTVSPVGGELLGALLVVSAGIPAGRLLLLNGASFAGNVGGIDIESADAATVQLSDAPDTPPGAGTVAVSMWQQNLLGVKATAAFALERLVPNGAAVVNADAWVSP